MAGTISSLDDLVDACVAQWPRQAALDQVSDDDLLASLRHIERLSRVLDVARSRRSAEVARRSSVELGHRGLAARRGATSATALIARETGSSRAGAARGIRVGDLLASDDKTDRFGAYSPLAGATADGTLGPEAADVATRILDPILDHVDPDEVAAGIVVLVGQAETRSVEEIATLARQLRDSLDRVGIEDRERALRARRALRRSPVVDGLRRITLVLDPESDAIVSGALDQILSPRLGGPRFTDASSKARADQLLVDERTNEQVALDALVDLVRIGTDADESRLLGITGSPVRITLTLDDLAGRIPAGPAGRRGSKGQPNRSLRHQPADTSAPPEHYRSSSAEPAFPSTSATPAACSPEHNATLSPSATADVGSGAATDPRSGAKPTTSLNGAPVDRPISPTASSSVADITSSSTTTDGASLRPPRQTDTSSTPHQAGPATSLPDPCPHAYPAGSTPASHDDGNSHRR